LLTEDDDPHRVGQPSRFTRSVPPVNVGVIADLTVGGQRRRTRPGGRLVIAMVLDENPTEYSDVASTPNTMFPTWVLATFDWGAVG
jgi:hypothetical protein